MRTAIHRERSSVNALERAAFNHAIQLQLDLLRHAASVEGKVLRLLEEMHRQLRGKLASKNLTTFNRTRLNAMLKETSALIDQVYLKIAAEVKKSTEVVSELAATTSAAATLEIGLTTNAPSPTVLAALAQDTLIDGAPSAAWWRRQAMDTTFRFANVVRQGIAQGDTSDQIYRKVGEVTDLM